ncbi:MAG: hypothetical protein ACYC8W_10700 [Candidatus Tyrphobacter sp.]
MRIERYRSAAGVLALGLLCACAPGPPHPQGWTQSANGAWTTMSGAGIERYAYAQQPSQGSLSDLASAQAVDTVQRHPGSKLERSRPFPACPGEAGLAEYRLAHDELLQVAFSVNNGRAIVAQYERPASIGESAAAMTALRQAVCFAL